MPPVLERPTADMTYNLLPVFVDAYKYSFFAQCIPVGNGVPSIAPSLPVSKTTVKSYLSSDNA